MLSDSLTGALVAALDGLALAIVAIAGALPGGVEILGQPAIAVVGEVLDGAVGVLDAQQQAGGVAGVMGAMPGGVTALDGVRLDVAAGRAHSLAFTASGLTFSWGDNAHGQCGLGLGGGAAMGEGGDGDRGDGREPAHGAGCRKTDAHERTKAPFTNGSGWHSS